MKKHHTTLYWLVFFLLVLQVLSFVFMGSKLALINGEIENTNNALEQNSKIFAETLQAVEAKNQKNFDEVTNVLSDQQKAQTNFQEELALVKSTSGDFSGVVENAVKSVVSISTDKSQGSGFFIGENGYIVTN